MYQLNPLLENVSRRLYKLHKNGGKILSAKGRANELAQNLINAKKSGIEFAKVAKKSKLADASAERAEKMADIVYMKDGSALDPYERAVEIAKKKAKDLRHHYDIGQKHKNAAKELYMNHNFYHKGSPIDGIINQRAIARAALY